MSRFYLCEVCGNLIEKVEDGGPTPSCCDQEMTALKAGSLDASPEKHVPIITITESPCSSALHPPIKKVHVVVGSKLHPTTEMHYINWIQLQTETGSYRRYLEPGDPTYACFILHKDEPVLIAYAYCNLHGLWRSEVKA